MKVDTYAGPAEWVEHNESLVDEILKKNYPAAVRQNAFLTEAVVAGVWLSIAVGVDREAASLLQKAIQQDFGPYDAAKAVAKGRGWAPGAVVDVVDAGLVELVDGSGT